MKILNIFLLLIFHLIKESLSYNDSIPFNWTKELDFCYREDFELNDLYRPFYPDIYPIRGCSFNEKNRLYEEKAYKAGFGLTNITYEPKLDFFFPRQEYPPLMRDPPTSMTFRLTGKCPDFESFFISHSQTIRIYFGRADDYLPIPKNSKKTGQAIQYNGKKAILKSRFKIAKSQLLYINNENEFDFSKNDYELLEYEGEEFNSYFDGFELDFSNLQNTNYFSNSKTNDPEFCNNPNDIYALLIKVYDLPRMKVQGLFQYNYSILSTDLKVQKSFIYTVDTRNIFFQNISMFYNQHVNVSADFDEPTAEDSGIWINTTCNTPNVATIMVDYFFFETIHKMQSFGYEFGDRFQLRIHTPWYRKTLNKRYSLFRYQWNSSYEKPRVFIHPISKYRDYCLTSGNNNICPRMFNFTKWSTDPLFTQFIIDIKHEIIENEIRINFTELEKIYEADGFQRTKLSINVNNTMAPHISQVTNGLWAELIDTVTNDWVMKTKTTMDEVYGYSGDKEPDPYRDFYLTCEIPDNITKDEVEIKLKRSGAFSTIHLWIKLDVFKKGITKMFPPRFNTIIKFPPQVRLTNRTFMYTYQYYRIPGGDEANWHYLIKDLRQTGLADGTITDETFDVGRNMVNISELHPNIPNGDDAMFYNQTYDYFCHEDFIKDQDCLKLENRRLYLYYFFDLEVEFIKNDTCPLEMIVYYVKYVPHHSKDQINRAIHRWNQHHAGWVINSNSIYEDSDNKKSFRYYYEPEQDNFFYREKGTNTYENKFGSSGVLSYGGPDCVFNFAGGSTLRNKTCEYWAGIIPDQPFTNYARDIVEEYVAYRTSKYEQAFRVHTYDDVKIEIINLKNLEPYPGKFTSIILEALFHDKDIPDALIDGEPTCGEFYEYPKVCEGSMNDYKPITNIYNHTKEYFVKIKLPKGIVASSESYGLADQCMRDNKYLRNNKYEYRDYLCLYFNQSFIYAFNSLSQWGFTKSRGIYDIKIHIDGLYIPENITELERESGRLEFGFFRSTFFYTEFPRLNKEDHKLYIKNNYTFGILKTEPKNEQKNAKFSVFINTKNIYDEDSIFIIDFPNEIEFAEAQGLNIGNAFLSDTALEVLRKNNYFSKINDNTNFILENLHINNTNIFNNTFVVYPFYDEKLSNYYNEENEDYNIEIIFYINNYRSFKPIEINIYRTNDSLITLFQHEKIIMNNSIPEKISNASLTIDTYYTSDRAIYTLEFYTDVDYIYEDDYLEYLTSWRSNFSNTEYNESYFKYRVKIDKNYTKWEKITVILNPVINPETLDDQYLQIFRILDKEGYVVAVSNENDNIMSLKMKKYISFKYSEIITEKTDKDYNIFNITVNLVPEVLTKGNDTLRLKFSKNVLFKDVPNINIVGIKGISSYSNDINVTNQYQMEYNEENNEIIITNAFPPIAESQFVFDNFTANALVDQELIFTFTDIPIKQINTTDEALFSVEAKTEAECEGKIITRQINTIPGVALFCGFTCRTCEKDNMQRCILCKESYPYLLTTIYKCISMCPDGFYVLEKEDVIECNKCLEPCSTCYENEINCTGCIEGYFLENNTCVQNCSENFAENEEDQRCYPILYLNETTFNDTYEYINVSVPTPYDVYINHNVCIFIDEEEEEKIINEYEDEIFKNIEEELNENKIEIEQNEIIKENEKDIKTEKELEIQKEETEKEYIKEYEKLKESKYEMEKEKEVELVNQNVEEKQKEMLEEYNEIEVESSIKIIEKELENKKEKFEIIEEEMIPEAVIEKEREIIKENNEENIKENLEENIVENIQENIEENIKEKELEIIKLIEKEKNKENDIEYEKEIEKEMLLKNEKEKEEEYENEIIFEKEMKQEKEIILKNEEEYEKEIILEKEEDDEKEIILEKEKKYEKEWSKETAIQNDTETEKEKMKELEEKIIESQKEYIEENEKEIKIQPFNEIEKEKEKEIYDFEEEQENKEMLKEIKEKNKEIELEKLEKEIAKEEEIENINKREEEYLAEIDEEKEKKIESEKINEKELEKEIEEKNIENEKQYMQEREIMKEKMKEKEKEIEKEYEIESEKIDEKEIEKKKELIIQKEEEIEKEIIGEQKIELLEKELKSEELIIEEEKYQKEKENYRYTDEIFIDNIEEYEEEIASEKSDKIIIQDNDLDLKPMCNPYFFDNLPHIFKYKNPFDYYLIPIISGLILLLLEILFCCKILNLSFYFLTYFILGIIFKILLILVFAYSFTTGYEYFFYTVAIIFMIYMFITMTFLLFNLCNKNSLNDLKTNYKCLWLLSLIGCLVSDYRCLELFTRTKIEIIDSNYRNKKGEIIKNNKNRKYNYKNNIDNNLDYTTNDNDDTDAHFKTIFKNRKIIEDKNTSTQNSFDNSNGLFNLNGIKKNNLNLNEIKDKDDKSENKDKAKFNEYKEYEKYFLVQESCINKTIIIFDLLFVYLAFIVICLYMIYKYKTYSTLWFLSIYGVIFAIINIIYYFRFKYIKINNRNEENKKEKIIKIKQKQKLGNNITQNKEIISNTSPQKLPTNHQKNIGSSFGKLLGTNNSIKEDLHEDDKTQNEKKINKFDNNITNINIIKNDINQINLDKNMKPMDMENDDDIIYNPYREDFIPESAASKKSKNNKNMDIPELKLKDIKNNNENNIGEEYNILKTYRSLESEDYKIGSINSKNNINNLKKFDTKIFHKSNEKQNEEKLDDDDEDNTSVIHNPLRDDI